MQFGNTLRIIIRHGRVASFEEMTIIIAQIAFCP